MTAPAAAHAPTAVPAPAAARYLSVNNIEVIYDHVILVLKGVSLEVPEGQHRGAARRQRRGQEHHAEVDLEPALRRARRRDQGDDRVQGPPRRQAHDQRARAHGRVPGDGGAPLLPAPDGRGKPAHRRVHAQGLARRARRGARARLPLFPAAQAAPREPVGLHVGRRAADDRDRPRADGAADDDPARRAVDGARAADRRGDLRDRAAT